MSDAWFPLLEDNQGTISIVALVVAIILFLVEQHRANRQRLLALDEEIQDALNLIELLEMHIRSDPDEEISILGVAVRPEQSATIIGMVRAMAAAHAKNPLVAVALLRAADAAEELDDPDIVGSDQEYIDGLLDELDGASADIRTALDRSRTRAETRAEAWKALDKSLKRLVRKQQNKAKR